jgi:hypothetical protein
MRLTVSSSVSCRLKPGELRRVPQNSHSYLVGYYVCCPRCGYVTIAFNGTNDLQIAEDVSHSVISFSKPLRCVYCSVLIHLHCSEAELEEDEHVRNVRYRLQ